MTEDKIQQEVLRIAVSEIGKKNIESASVKPEIDFDGREILEITAILKPLHNAVPSTDFIFFLRD